MFYIVSLVGVFLLHFGISGKKILCCGFLKRPDNRWHNVTIIEFIIQNSKLGEPLAETCTDCCISAWHMPASQQLLPEWFSASLCVNVTDDRRPMWTPPRSTWSTFHRGVTKTNLYSEMVLCWLQNYLPVPLEDIKSHYEPLHTESWVFASLSHTAQNGCLILPYILQKCLWYLRSDLILFLSWLLFLLD